jgi:hypothetical protein
VLSAADVLLLYSCCFLSQMNKGRNACFCGSLYAPNPLFDEQLCRVVGWLPQL